jgi:hypothetical protein
MWLTRDYHVTPHYSQLLLHVRAVDALPYQNMRCHDNHMTCYILCAPESAQCVPASPPFGGAWGLHGDETSSAVALNMRIQMNGCGLILWAWLIWPCKYLPMALFRAFVSLSAGIQASTWYCRGSSDDNRSLEKFLSSYLKVAKNAKITPNFKRIFLRN